MSKTRSNANLLAEIDNLITAKFDQFAKSRSEEVESLLELNRKLIEQNRDLVSRVETLENQLKASPKPTPTVTALPPTADLPCQPAATAAAGPSTNAARQATPDNRVRMPCLLLSDSMFRFVTLLEGTKKVIIPGARCHDLFWELAELNRTHIFEEIIVHVGTNYLGDWHDANIISEVCDFLISARKFLPASTKLTFSSILPRRHTDNRPFSHINSINFINGQIDYFTERHGIGIINYDCFHDGYIFRLLGKDGVHLNRNGVSEVGEAIRCHQKYSLAYLW